MAGRDALNRNNASKATPSPITWRDVGRYKPLGGWPLWRFVENDHRASNVAQAFVFEEGVLSVLPPHPKANNMIREISKVDASGLSRLRGTHRQGLACALSR